MSKKYLLSGLILFGSCSSTWAVDLIMPFNAGDTWVCTQGNYLDSDNTLDDPNPTHVTSKVDPLKETMKYAIDFSKSGALGEPILAPADGRVVYAGNTNTGWGNAVIIDYGDGTFGKLAHLNIVTVSVGSVVKQGQQIGTCGGTGGWPVHLHYQTQNSSDINGQSIPLVFKDVFNRQVSNDGVIYYNTPQRFGLYTSANSYCSLSSYRVGKFSDGDDGWRFYQGSIDSGFVPRTKPFSLTYYHLGGHETFGHPIS